MSKSRAIGKNSPFFILVIFLAALLARVAIIYHDINNIPRDIDGYDELATNVLGGKGFVRGGKPTSFHEPFYPFFLAGIYYVFGHNYLAVQIIQCLLGAIMCIIIYSIAGMLFNQQVAFVSATIAAFYPAFIKSTEKLMTESLFIFLLALAIYFLVRQSRKYSFINLIFLGIILGIAALTRSVVLFLPFFIMLLSRKVLSSRDCYMKKHILTNSILVLSFILTIFPWTLRNWRIHHSFVPIVTKTGIGFYTSYTPKNGKLYGFIADDRVTQKADLLSSEVEQSKFLSREAWKSIRSNPLRIFKLEILKGIYFWSLFDWEIIGEGVYNFMYGFIIPFFIYGIFVNRARFKELLTIYLIISYFFLLALFTYGSPRFRLPIEPYIIIISSAGVIDFIKMFTKKIYAFFWISTYFMVNLFLYFNSYQTKIITRSIFEKIYLW